MRKEKGLQYKLEEYFSGHKEEILEKGYLILFAVFFADAFLHTTMFLTGDHTQLHLMMWIVMLVFLFGKTAMTPAAGFEGILLPCVVMLSFFVAYGRRSRYEILITFALLTLGARGVSFRKIVRLYFLLGIVFMGIMMIAAGTGQIENLVYYQEGRRVRTAFGAVYPTDFSAHVFYLCLAWAYLRKEKVTIRELVIFLFCGAEVYIFCDARMNSGMIFLLTLLLFYHRFRTCLAEKKGKAWRRSRLVNRMMVWSVPLCAGIITLLTAVYRDDNKVWQIINWMTSSRLLLGKRGMEEYGFSWFGQYIPMVGFGGTTEVREDYFFIDSSYISILLCMGTVVFFVVCLLSVKITYRAWKQKDFIFLLIFSCMALQCVVEHHMLEIAYNPFLLAAFADTGRRKKPGMKEIRKRGNADE